MSTLALQTLATINERTVLSAENYRLRLECPEIAARILPGQFFMIRLPERSDPLLARPFALYDTVLDEAGNWFGIDVGIHQVGKMTSLLDRVAIGSEVEIWGPLGNGFPAIETEHLIQVAGGIGYTPFVALTREALQGKTYGIDAKRKPQVNQVSLIYGVRTKKLRANLNDWADLPELEVEICTDDGSEGHHGLVTDLLEQKLKPLVTAKTVVFTCGPMRMMRAVAEMCQQYGVPCYASLETPMACGYGACFSCVIPVRQMDDVNGWDYRRSCVEGPVFPATDICWEQM